MSLPCPSVIIHPLNYFSFFLLFNTSNRDTIPHSSDSRLWADTQRDNNKGMLGGGGIEYHCCLVWWKSKSVPCGDTEMLVRRLTECARSCLVLQSVTAPGRTQVGGCNQTERAAVFFYVLFCLRQLEHFFFFTTLFQFHFKWTSYSVWIA